MNHTAKRIFAVILLLITAALLIFIWGNSLMSRQQSHLQSKAALQAVSMVFSSMSNIGITEPILRKLAHFLEFFALAVSITLLFRLYRPFSIQLLFNVFSLGLIAAVIDESLQIISKRGPMVSDILIDQSGVCVGALFALMMILIAKKIFKKRFA